MERIERGQGHGGAPAGAVGPRRLGTIAGQNAVFGGDAETCTRGAYAPQIIEKKIS
jgi:hypothetical protein